jgi:DNA-binding NtrC family response regulator
MGEPRASYQACSTHVLDSKTQASQFWRMREQRMNAEISEARQLAAESIVDHKAFESKVRAAITQSGGNVAEAARILGVSRRTMTRYVAEDKSLAELVTRSRNKNDTDEREYNRKMQRKSRARRAKE